MTCGKIRLIKRKQAFKKFKKVYGRKPTELEKISFDSGFNMGWKQGKLRERKLSNMEEDYTPRLIIHEKDVRDLGLTAEICAKLLQPIFGTIYIEKLKNEQ